jgi:hypothetical protein
MENQTKTYSQEYVNDLLAKIEALKNVVVQDAIDMHQLKSEKAQYETLANKYYKLYTNLYTDMNTKAESTEENK